MRADVPLSALVDSARAGVWGNDARSPETPIPARIVRNGDVPDDRYIRWEELPIRWVSERDLHQSRVTERDTLLVSSGYIGKSARLARFDSPEPIVASNFVRILRPAAEVDPGWLFWLIGTNDALTAMKRRAAGTSILNLQSSFFSQWSTPFVPPLPEQRAIAAVLDAVDDTIQRTEAVIAATEELRRALLEELLTRGVPGWHSEWRDVPGLGTVPACWEVTTLGEVVAEPIRNGYSAGTVEEPTGWWILTLGAVSHQGFVPEAKKPTPLDARVLAAELRPGDLLVSRSNTVDRVGLAGIYRGIPMDCSYPDLLMRVRIDDRRALTEFVEAVLLSRPGRRYFERQARGTSGSMVKITGDILRAFPLALPLPTEQTQVVELLSSATNVSTSEWATLNEARRLKATLAGDLLTGRIRLPEVAHA